MSCRQPREFSVDAVPAEVLAQRPDIYAAAQDVVAASAASVQADAQRSGNAQAAANGFDRAYQATAASYRAGATSLFDLEDARRSLVAAQNTMIDLHRERLFAWIALYRSVGGGWTSTLPTPLAQHPNTRVDVPVASHPHPRHPA
ncbi:TolC family protein [Pigmentiphaga aceris]|nr:TolC family protein [Pigmentiphaga aceris]